jgi:catechol 2,3-dioxygenase-like lactoylglutathione lyase family enzyme
MTVRMAQYTIDVEDLDAMVAFWSAALGYEVEQGDDGSAKLWPPGGPSAAAPSIWLQGSGTAKRGKNRVHLDLVADVDPQAEVRRLVGLGARPVDVGQTGAERFTVLADPEGNEFCVLDGPPRR